MAAKKAPRNPHEQYRLADIPVDDAWVRKNNENLAEVRRLQWSALVLGLLVLAAGIGLLLYSEMEMWGWMIAVVFGIFALGCFAMIFYIPRKMGSMARTYAVSELVPAVVAEVRPRGVTLLALVDQAVDRSTGSQPALASRSCEKIPGHEVRVGERVPSVAVVGNRNARRGDNTYQFISPMPVAWATGDRSVLRRLVGEIPGSEWERLRQSIDKVEQVSSLPNNLLPLD